MTTLLEKATVWSWAEEPNYRAPLRATGPGTLAAHAAVDDNGERFSATGAGTTTTTVAAGVLTEATAAGYCGCLMRCTAATNAQNVGIVVVIQSFNAGTDTLTHTPFPAATSSGDQFELADIDVRVVETAGGSSAQVDSALRINAAVEPDDFWNGYSLVAEAPDNTPLGTTIAVTDFTAASGRLTAALPGASVIGDLWWLRKFPKLLGAPTIEWTQEDIERPVARGVLGEEPTVPGSRSWSSEWVLPLKGSGTAAGAGVAGVPPPEAEPVLRSVFERRQSTGSAVVAQAGGSPANSTTVFNIATGTLGNYPVGSFVHDNAGRTACVTASAANGGDPDSITVRPALGRIPVVGEVMRGGAAYAPQLSGHRTMTLDAIMGRLGTASSEAIRWIGFGGLPTVRVTDIGRNKIPKLVLGFRGGYWVSWPITAAHAAVASQNTLAPRSAADSYVLLVPEGSDSVTRLIVEDGDIDFGMALVDEGGTSLFDGQYGGRVVDSVVRVNLTCKLDVSSPNNSYAEVERYYASRVFTLHLQHHDVPGRTISFYAHRCAFLFPAHAVADGLHKLTLRVQVLASELTSMPICNLAWT